MPSTSKGFRYPNGSDAPDIDLYIKNLADDLNAFLYLGDRYKTFQKSTGVATNTHTTLTDILSGTWTSAPAGDYLIHTTLTVSSTNPGGNIEVKVNGNLISVAAHRADVDTYVTTITNVHPYTHAATGNLLALLRHGVSVGTATTFNAGCKIVVQYLGRRV